jgi:hypothetical protein
MDKKKQYLLKIEEADERRKFLEEEHRKELELKKVLDQSNEEKRRSVN